jgi:putative signal transducing protein
MREVFVNQDHARVGFYKSILDEAGIPNFVRNEYINNSVTELPSPLFFPALCVVHDDDYERAMKILREIYYAPPSQAPDWPCPKCGEEVPGNFDSCWKCGAPRTDSPGTEATGGA